MRSTCSSATLSRFEQCNPEPFLSEGWRAAGNFGGAFTLSWAVSGTLPKTLAQFYLNNTDNSCRIIGRGVRESHCNQSFGGREKTETRNQSGRVQVLARSAGLTEGVIQTRPDQQRATNNQLGKLSAGGLVRRLRVGSVVRRPQPMPS